MSRSSCDLSTYEREVQRQIAEARQSMGRERFEQALDRYIDTMAFLGWLSDCGRLAGGIIPGEVIHAIAARYPGFLENYEENEPDGEYPLLAALSVWAISILQNAYDEEHWAGIAACANRDPRSAKIQEYQLRDSGNPEKPLGPLLSFDTWKRTALVTPL